MADRTWNPIDSKLYDEDWSQGAIIVASCLIARCPNQYGVFDMPWGFLTRFHTGIFDREQIKAFVQEWVEAGFVKLYDGGKTVWIVKKFKRSSGYMTNPKHAKGLIAFLNDYPDISPDFINHYDLHTLLNNGSITNKPVVNDTPIINQSLPNDTTDTDTDSDTESDTEKKSRKRASKSYDLDGFALELIEFTYEMFSKETHQGWKGSDWFNQVDALDKLIRIDKFPQDEVFKVLRYMRGNDFWDSKFQSMPSLRKNGQSKFRSAQGQIQPDKATTRLVDSDESKWDGQSGMTDMGTGKTITLDYTGGNDETD